MIVISDASILIGLAHIGKIDLLRHMFSKIYLPEEVFQEITEKGKDKPGAALVKEAAWLESKAVIDRTEVRLLMVSLDRGEAEVLALAKEMQADVILIDEEKARKSAVLAGFNIMGIVGVFMLAKKLGLLPQIKPCLQELQKKKFRISDKIVKNALQQAGE